MRLMRNGYVDRNAVHKGRDRPMNFKPISLHLFVPWLIRYTYAHSHRIICTIPCVGGVFKERNDLISRFSENKVTSGAIVPVYGRAYRNALA